MSTDPNLDIELDSDVIEVGGLVSGRIHRWPSDGDDNSKKIGKVEAIRIEVSWRTEGRGDRDGATVGKEIIQASDFGQAHGEFSIPIPPNVPISYDGSLIRVIWKLEARTDRKWAPDPKNNLRLLIVPRNGVDRYTRPHPLPKAGYTPGARLGEEDVPFGVNPADGMGDQPNDGDSQDWDHDTDDTNDNAQKNNDPFADRPDYLDEP